MDPHVVKQLEAIVGEDDVLVDDVDLLLYSYDASLPEFGPDAVVFPRTTEEVSRVTALASQEGIPVVPRGAATGLAGGSVPVEGGIALSLTKMNRILNIDADNLIAEVEPGLVNAHLQSALAPHGLFFPPDPASLKVCTLGGNVATDAGGPLCVKYGVTKNYVLGLEVVLADGEVINTGGNVVKNTTGYALTQLLVGSEGTLGILTKLILRVMPRPQGKRTMLAMFDSLEAASQTVSSVTAAGIVPSTLEMMDNLLIRCAENFVHIGLPTDAAAMLLIEVDGPEASLDPQLEAVKGLCEEHGATEIRVATSAEEVDRLWLARRSIVGAVTSVRPSLILQDVTVPRSRLPAMVARVGEISAKYDLPIAVLAHAGDGNLHPMLLFDARDAGEMERVSGAEKEIFAAALEMDGTLTGEHGIGITKRDYLPGALGPRLTEVTRRVKAAFDPQNILNPGKILA